MTIEILNNLIKEAKSDFYKNDDFYDMLQGLIYEYELKEYQFYKNLESKRKKINEYKILAMIEKTELAKICKDKIDNLEQSDRFYKLYKKNCLKQNKDILNQNEIDNADSIEVKYILETITDIQVKKNSSNCPFCGGNRENKFSVKGNLFYCFKCGEKGNGIQLFQKLTGNDFKTSVRALNNL